MNELKQCTSSYFDETKFDEKESPFFFIGGLEPILQAADVMLYMANRCEGRAPSDADKHHEKELRRLWEGIKAGGQVKIQRWP